MAESILIIDDDVNIRESLRIALGFELYEIFLAANGQEGLNLLQKFTPSIILLDLMMPVVSGWQLSEVLAQNKILSRIPLIVLSAFTHNVSRIKADAFIGKPFDLLHLLKVIKNLILKNEKTGADYITRQHEKSIG